MAERSYRPWLWALALVGLSLDLGSKYGVFHWLNARHARSVDLQTGFAGRHDLVPGVFEFIAAFTDKRDDGTSLLSPLRTLGVDRIPEVNHGALFGIGRGHVSVANGIFAVVSLLAAGAIIFWSKRPDTARDGFLCAALGLILGGTLGNLFDRIVFNGVRDFLHFYWIEWPVFNVADCLLVSGAGLLLLQAVLTPAPAGEADEAASATLAAQPVEVK